MSSSPTRRDPYDEMPYVSMPITYTQPASLAAQAVLRGLEAPDVETATVLEIGAASGGNIIPLAARFPRAHFLGVDLAEAHVEIGRRRIVELGLSNVRLEQGDITDAAFGAQRFDYIICHGVFSWAPPEARQGILRACSESLTGAGIAAISFNVFPGWHARNVIRDICLEHTRKGGSPRQRVESVRALLKSLAETSNANDPYGAILRAEAARLSTRPASYILGELLAACNQPFHVRDVIGLANAQGLTYLGEADLMSSVPEYAAPAAADRIRAIAGADPVAIEQYVDIFSGRTFRRSLFVRSGRQVESPSPERLRSLHVVGNPRAPLPEPASDPVGARLRTRLAGSFPGSAAIADFAPADIPALYQMIARGHCSIATHPFTTGASDQAYPCLWSVARSDVTTSQPWVTSLAHAPVLLTPLLRVLAPLMTGQTSREHLSRALASALESGAISEPDLPEVVGAPDRLAAIVDRLVQHCARNALLAL